MFGTKIYIAGKISGIESEAFEIFKNAENHLKSLGFTPVNPMELLHNHDKKWSSYMKECLKELFDCNGIYMLKNWEESEGAKLEHSLANALEINIIYQ